MTQKAGTAVQDSGGHAKVFPPLDPDTFAPQLVWLALAFGLLYLLMKRVVLPRVGEVIGERSDRLKRDLAQAGKFKIAAEQALVKYGQALAEARSEAAAIGKSLREKLGKDLEKERMKAEIEITSELAAAEQRIAETKAKALASVDEIASDVASSIIVKLIGTEVSKDEVQKALVQRAAE
jgi:F-type H+-transporting ATPase subunit b